MKAFRIAVFALAILYAIGALWGLLIGSFADGGTWWQYITFIVVQPLAAAALVTLAAASPGALSALAQRLIKTALVAAVALNGFAAVMIAQGIVRGDWWIPFAFALIPAIGLAYTATLGRGSRSAAIA